MRPLEARQRVAKALLLFGRRRALQPRQIFVVAARVAVLRAERHQRVGERAVDAAGIDEIAPQLAVGLVQDVGRARERAQQLDDAGAGQAGGVVVGGTRAPAERDVRRLEQLVDEALEGRALRGGGELRRHEGEAAAELVEDDRRAIAAQLGDEGEVGRQRRAVAQVEPRVGGEADALGGIERLWRR